MPIEPSKAVGHAFAPASTSYKQDDVILYHLGIGAGVPQTDAGGARLHLREEPQGPPELRRDPGLRRDGRARRGAPACSSTRRSCSTASRTSRSTSPFPVAAEVESSGKVAGLYDKGKAALAVLELQTRIKGESEPLFTNRFSLFLRGEGGFGGESGPASRERRARPRP